MSDEAIQNNDPMMNPDSYKEIMKNKGDREFMLKLIRQHPHVVIHVSESLQRDTDFLNEVSEISKEAKGWVDALREHISEEAKGGKSRRRRRNNKSKKSRRNNKSKKSRRNKKKSNKRKSRRR